MIKKLFQQNFFADFLRIGFIQSLNYLVPLLIIPILVRMVGKENFGLISHSQSLIAWFLVFINYSFDLTATRELAINGNQQDKREQLFNVVFQTKLVFFAITAVLFLIILLLVPSLRIHWQLHAILFLSNLGFVLYQSWFFQGERIFRIAAVFNLVAKLILGLGVLVLIRRKEDVMIYAWLIFISQLFMGIFGLVYILKKYRIRFFQVGKKAIVSTIRSGWAVFLSNMFINLSTTSNVFILGFFASLQEVANFAAGTKIIAIMASVVITSFTISAYPLISKKLSLKDNQGITMIQLNTWISLIVGGLIAVGMMLTAPWVITLIYGNEFADAVLPYRILCILPIFIFLNNVLGVQALLSFKMDTAFFKLTAVSSTISVVSTIILGHFYQDMGAATAWVITEVFISITLIVILSKRMQVFDFSALKQMKTLYAS